ncbi:sulfotransferase family protein [Roseobacter sp. YSTF-M11]|uniref:Sulfotransferase family protein n=1 Tax=Roseobacter insulae TaxID=2859783 RepID=A0A9X1FV61_9RHOB|nr:sulfotransferase family 2 domain-containing protein [Roseobacter insulae]MBW4707710.1 sulfotransferase family protein [Roseobacter insulae]
MVIAVSAHKIAYMAVPKAACTSVKAALASIDPGAPVTLEQVAQDHDLIHKAYHTRRFRPHRWRKYSDWWRFTVVRDPLKRLLAVYSDRVDGRKDLLKSPRIRRQSDVTDDPDPDFFFQNIETYMQLSSVIKHHALPTRLFVGVQPLDFDAVYTVARIPDLQKDLSARVGHPVTVPRFNSSKRPLRLDDLTPRTQAVIGTFLQPEYEHLAAYYDNPFT